MLIYVDTENMEANWVDVLPHLGESDTIYVFYTKNSKGLDIGKLDLIRNASANIILLPASIGDNALDFVLSSQLGNKIDDAKTHIILSGDNGYTPLVKFWEERAEVFLISDIEQVIEYIKTGTMPKAKPLPSGRLVMEIDMPEEQRRQVQSVLDKVGNGDLNAIYQSLIKTFGQEEGLAIYKEIRSRIR